MLTHKEVSPTCIYWANRFKSRTNEFDELYNVAYLIAMTQTTVLTLQKSIKGGLLRFMNKRRDFTAKCSPVENDHLATYSENPIELCSKDDCIQSAINSEELSKILEESNIAQSSDCLKILRLIFVEGLTQRQIAEKYHVTQQRISQRYDAVIERLITVNKRRMLCLK